MKRVLITGANSYIGSKLKTWLEQKPNQYNVDVIGLRDNSWKGKDFSRYNVVFHTAGIAHKKETKDNKNLYYLVNRDLAYDVAKKAKADGVNQFIFLSSMSIYGMERGIIDENSPLNPQNNYGISKLQAERLIEPLEDQRFKVSILRPPMIYGKGCKGNYPRLSSLAVKLPLFPNINNKRSMLYIDNLSEFVRKLIDNCASGLFFPQNADYVCTSQLVRMIAETHGKRIKLTKVFNPFIRKLDTSTVNKVFGDLVYDKGLSECSNKANISLKKSIQLTEL